MIITSTYLDLNFVTNRLAIGANIGSREQLEELKQLGITHIINCQSDDNDADLFTKEDAFCYLWNGTDDDGAPKPVEWFKKGIEFALPALAQPNTKIYVHCWAGINRGPSMGYAILRAQGLDQITTKGLIKNVRPFADMVYRLDADDAIKNLGYE